MLSPDTEKKREILNLFATPKPSKSIMVRENKTVERITAPHQLPECHH